MRDTRFIFVEGIMGAGKSTTVERLSEYLIREGIAATPMWEGPTIEEPDQPLRMSTSLPHPFSSWDDLTVEEYFTESLSRWRQFATDAETSGSITVCDGLLFHGNMTDLMLMGAQTLVLQEYVAGVIGALHLLNPVVLYLRRSMVSAALHEIVAARGETWKEYQVNWKLRSPYGVRRNLHAFGGLVDLYQEYQAVCDRIFEDLPVPKLLVNSNGDWSAISCSISRFLELRGLY